VKEGRHRPAGGAGVRDGLGWDRARDGDRIG